MRGGGLLIPPWFEYHEPSCSDWAIVSIAFGMTLCLAIFGLIRVGIQTYHQWKRAQRITTYMVLIWLELVSSAIIGGLGWGYVRGTIRPGQTYIDINNIWDRIEKGIFAVIDLALNFYFVYLVRSSLISYGLTKYVVLYRFNLVMVIVSISMDILIIGSMSLRNTFLYVEFHPLAYLVKLHIELSMAELIAKIVKASGPNLAPCRCTCHDNPNHTFLHQLQSRHSAPAATSVTAPTTGRFRRSWPMSKATRSREKRRGGTRSQTPSLTKKMVSKKRQSTEENQPKQEVWKSDTNTAHTIIMTEAMTENRVSEHLPHASERSALQGQIRKDPGKTEGHEQPFLWTLPKKSIGLVESPRLWVGPKVDPTEQLPAHPALLLRGLRGLRLGEPDEEPTDFVRWSDVQRSMGKYHLGG
ncbi:hypothetical protein FMUND_9965 [Fusarium mundagurra]|uniref:Integral membrane protein n=1 Tax=Fusarium mundagurra TaxID=1567541 RepID=A0A8H6DAH8_9HYPO|nr:hypothetical protein FMUND_9965 [Fusarium mundagurra]